MAEVAIARLTSAVPAAIEWPRMTMQYRGLAA